MEVGRGRVPEWQGLYTEWKNELNRLAFSRSVVALAESRKTVDGIELLLESERI